MDQLQVARSQLSKALEVNQKLERESTTMQTENDKLQALLSREYKKSSELMEQWKRMNGALQTINNTAPPTKSPTLKLKPDFTSPKRPPKPSRIELSDQHEQDDDD